MFEELRRVALFTSGVAELTRNQAERLVKDMVEKGDLRRKQASDAVRELVTTSKQSREMLIEFVRGEIRNQIAQLGVANKRDLERLERRIARLEGRTSAKGSAGAKKTTRSRPGSEGGPERTDTGVRKKSARKTTPPKKTSPSGSARTFAAPRVTRPPGDEQAPDSTPPASGSS